MRIATWNCQGGLDKKVEVVRSLAADVVVIQESAQSTTLSRQTDTTYMWKTPGSTASKGIAVLGFNGWTVSSINEPTEMPWVLPVRVASPDHSVTFTLLAMWTNTSGKDGRPPYAAQVSEALTAWRDTFSTPTIVAGDFNSSAQGPQKEAHARNVATWTDLGARSAYHAANQLDHGSEADMTLKWIGPGRKEYQYHCDFICVSSHFGVVSCEVMPIWQQFVRQPSDHQPVIATLDLAPARAGTH